MEALAKLKPAFKKDGGTVTAGNASGLNDGGAALILMSAEKARELGMKPLARVVASASGAVEPRIMGRGPVPATLRALKFAGLTLNDIDYWELNETFASQALACMHELKVPLDRGNANGSGIFHWSPRRYDRCPYHYCRHQRNETPGGSLRLRNHVCQRRTCLCVHRGKIFTNETI